MSKAEEYFENLVYSPTEGIVPICDQGDQVREYGHLCKLEGKIEELKALKILSPYDAKEIDKRIQGYERELEVLVK